MEKIENFQKKSKIPKIWKKIENFQKKQISKISTLLVKNMDLPFKFGAEGADFFDLFYDSI